MGLTNFSEVNISLCYVASIWVIGGRGGGITCQLVNQILFCHKVIDEINIK